MATLFDDISTAEVIAAIVVGCGLLALINFTSFGGKKAARTAQ
jgi:hypothetical protein